MPQLLIRMRNFGISRPNAQSYFLAGQNRSLSFLRDYINYR